MYHFSQQHSKVNLAHTKKFRDNFLVRRIIAQQQSNFAVKLLSIHVFSDKKIRIMPDVHT